MVSPDSSLFSLKKPRKGPFKSSSFSCLLSIESLKKSDTRIKEASSPSISSSHEKSFLVLDATFSPINYSCYASVTDFMVRQVV